MDENIKLIEQKIYVVRGGKVMLDADLAEVYQVDTRVLNQAVKRNLERFPEDFMFQLTEDEMEDLAMRSQFVIASKRNVRYRPYAFTEHGAVMLASVLKSPQAIAASIGVVRAFVRLRTILAEHKELAAKIEELEKATGAKFAEQDDKINSVLKILKKLIETPTPEKRQIGYIGANENG